MWCKRGSSSENDKSWKIKLFYTTHIIIIFVCITVLCYDISSSFFSVLQCQHVVYAVRSHDNHETSNVVGACLEQHKKTDHQESREYIRAPLDTFTGSTCDAGYHITLLKRKVYIYICTLYSYTLVHYYSHTHTHAARGPTTHCQ